MKRILRWLFGITAVKLIELKEGDCLLVITPEGRSLSTEQLMVAREVFERQIGKRVIIAEEGIDLTVIRPPRLGVARFRPTAASLGD